MESFLTPWRMRVYPRLLLFALLLPVVIAVLAGSGSETVTGHLGGDLPAFYGAGKIVNEYGVEHIYDQELLAEVQGGFSTRKPNERLPFFYPPFVAQAYSALALVPYRLAYVLHTLVMLAAVALSVQLLRVPLRRVDRWPLESTALAIGLYPLYRAVTGGQNTALTLLILAATYRAAHDDRPVLAGALVGLLLYKPQYAIPVIGLIALRNPRAVLGFAAVGAAIWSWGALLAGPDWVTGWFQAARTISSELGELYPWWKISFIGFVEQIVGFGSIAAYLIGGLLVVPTIIALMWLWRRPDVSLDLKVGAATVGVLLIPNYVMWYESGLLALPLLIGANREGRSAVLKLLGLGALVASAFLVSEASSVPLLAAVLLTGVWIVAMIRADLEATRSGEKGARLVTEPA